METYLSSYLLSWECNTLMRQYKEVVSSSCFYAVVKQKALFTTLCLEPHLNK